MLSNRDLENPVGTFNTTSMVDKNNEIFRDTLFRK